MKQLVSGRKASMRLIGVFIMIILSACRGASEPSEGTDVIRVGAAISTSGPLSIEGTDLKRGYEMWVDTVNQDGGIEVNGEKRKVELITYDDESDPETAIRLVQRLVTRDKVDFVFGPYGSGLTAVVAPIIETNRIPLMASGAAPLNDSEQGFRYQFSPLTIVSQYYDVLLEGAAAEGAKTVGIIHLDISVFHDLANGVREMAESLGMEVTSVEVIPAELQDFSGPMSQIVRDNPDIFIGAGDVQQSMDFVRTMREAGWTPRFAFMQDIDHPEVVTELGKSTAEGIGGPVQWHRDAPWEGEFIGSARDYYEMFNDKYGTSPSYLAAGATAGGLALQLAIEEAGTTDGEAVAEALTRLDVETFYGHLGFSSPDDPSGLMGSNLERDMLGVQLLNGEPVIVAPADLAQVLLQELVPWSDR